MNLLYNLLCKLGLIKISLDEAKEILKRMFDDVAQQISKQSDSTLPNFTEIEVKIWVWAYIMPTLQKFMSDEMRLELNIYISKEVVVGNSDSEKKVAISSKIDDRIAYHFDNLKSLHQAQPPVGSYPQTLCAILFEQPLGDLEEIVAAEKISLDMDSIIQKQILGNNLINNVLPSVAKGTEKILKLVRKQD